MERAGFQKREDLTFEKDTGTTNNFFITFYSK